MSGYRVFHSEWRSVKPTELGKRCQLRTVRSHHMEVLHLEVRGDAPVHVDASPGEWHVQVLEGTTNIEIMGNTIELETERFALLPPNIPFEIVSGSRHGTCLLLIHAPADRPATVNVASDDEEDDTED